MPNFEVLHDDKYAYIKTADKIFSPIGRVYKQRETDEYTDYFVSRIGSILVRLSEMGIKSACLKWGMSDHGHWDMTHGEYGESLCVAVDYLDFGWRREHTHVYRVPSPISLLQKIAMARHETRRDWPVEEEEPFTKVDTITLEELIPESILDDWRRHWDRENN